MIPDLILVPFTVTGFEVPVTVQPLASVPVATAMLVTVVKNDIEEPRKLSFI